jgi:hypothetical protein
VTPTAGQRCRRFDVAEDDLKQLDYAAPPTSSRRGIVAAAFLAHMSASYAVSLGVIVLAQIAGWHVGREIATIIVVSPIVLPLAMIYAGVVFFEYPQYGPPKLFLLFLAIYPAAVVIAYLWLRRWKRLPSDDR